MFTKKYCNSGFCGAPYGTQIYPTQHLCSLFISANTHFAHRLPWSWLLTRRSCCSHCELMSGHSNTKWKRCFIVDFLASANVCMLVRVSVSAVITANHSHAGSKWMFTFFLVCGLFFLHVESGDWRTHSSLYICCACIGWMFCVEMLQLRRFTRFFCGRISHRGGSDESQPEMKVLATKVMAEHSSRCHILLPLGHRFSVYQLLHNVREGWKLSILLFHVNQSVLVMADKCFSGCCLMLLFYKGEKCQSFPFFHLRSRPCFYCLLFFNLICFIRSQSVWWIGQDILFRYIHS